MDQKPKEPDSGGGKGDAHKNFVRLRTRDPALRDLNTAPLRAVVAAHVDDEPLQWSAARAKSGLAPKFPRGKQNSNASFGNCPYLCAGKNCSLNFSWRSPNLDRGLPSTHTGW